MEDLKASRSDMNCFCEVGGKVEVQLVLNARRNISSEYVSEPHTSPLLSLECSRG